MNDSNRLPWWKAERGRVRDAVAAFSFAHLVFIRILLLLLQKESWVYTIYEPHNRSDYRAALADIFLLSAFLYAALRVARKIEPGRWRECARILGLAALVFPLDQIRLVFGIELVPLLRLGKPVLAGAALAVLAAAWRYRRPLSRLAFRACLGAVFTTCLYIPRVAWWAVRGGVELPPPPPSFTVHRVVPPGLRVVWVIFDEWDERVTFDARPKGVRLPNIDAIIKTAVVATNAYPPAGNTMQSIPCLLLGRYLQDLERTDEGGLRTQSFGSTNWNDFAADDHLVKLALESGRHVGVAGWFHPYPRLLGARPELWTFWKPPPFSTAFSRADFLPGCAAQFCYAFNQRWYVGQYAAAVDSLLNASSSLLQNSNVDLIYLHLPLPHAPGVYNPRTGRFDARHVLPRDGYFDNLALADRVLGEFQAELSRSGLRDRTALVLSSDHWWRTSSQYDGIMEHRVPFIVQLPNASSGRTFSRPINTVLTKELVLSLLSGAVGTPDQVVAFLESKAQPKPTAYHGPDNYGLPPEASAH